jgi:hypothetical protein
LIDKPDPRWLSLHMQHTSEMSQGKKTCYNLRSITVGIRSPRSTEACFVAVALHDLNE